MLHDCVCAGAMHTFSGLVGDKAAGKECASDYVRGVIRFLKPAHSFPLCVPRALASESGRALGEENLRSRPVVDWVMTSCLP